MKLLKAAQIEIGGRSYPLRYYEAWTVRGARRYCCEVVLGPSDCIIFDDALLSALESKVERLAPATVYSRTLLAS